MDELSSVLGEVLRVLGMEGPGHVRPPRGSADRRCDPGDCHDAPEELPGG